MTGVMRQRLMAVSVLAGCALLAGCGDTVRQTLGIDRSVPDEFAVVSRAPLSMPPSERLPEPDPGAPRPQEGTAADRGRAVVMGQGDGSTVFTAAAAPAAQAPSGLTPSERALISGSGADRADPNIRRTLNQESTRLALEDESFIQELLFWQDPGAPGTVVDPVAERERINRNLALGQPVNDGRVIIIERRGRAPLEGVFDGLF